MSEATEFDALPDDLIDTVAAGKLADCVPYTICRWVKAGKLRGWRRGARIYVSAAEVRQLFALVVANDATGHLRPTPTRERRAHDAWTDRILREHGLR